MLNSSMQDCQNELPPAMNYLSPQSLIILIRQNAWRIVTFTLSIVITNELLALLRLNSPEINYNWTFIPWISAILLFTGAVIPLKPLKQWHWREKCWIWWQDHRQSSLMLALLFFVAFSLRVWRVGDIPQTLGGDEGSQGLEAIRILKGLLRNPFTTGWLGVPTMSFYFNAPSIKFWGNTIFALRFPWTLVGTLTVLVTFFLVKQLKGTLIAAVTATLLATYHYHIHFSRLGSNQVADALFVALALLFLYRGFDHHSPLDWALSGITLGVAQFFYAGARFTIIITLFMLGYFILRGRLQFLRQQYKHILIFLGAGIITSAPMIQYALLFPNDYNARINQVGIIQNGWLKQEQELRHQGPLPILFEQAQKAALAFNFYPDRTPWYGSPKPLLDFTAGALFLLGLLYAMLRLDDSRLTPMVAWWWGATLMGGALTESPPSSQRLITLAIPTIFFVALALVKIGEIFFKALVPKQPQRFFLPYLAIAVVSLSFISLKWYFVEFTPMQLYGSYNGLVATTLGKYARDSLGNQWKIYFFGAPRMYANFGSIPYLAPAVEREDIAEPLTSPLARNLIKTAKNAAFVFLPERRNELAFVQKAFPGGTVEDITSPIKDEPLFILYRVPQAKLTGGN